MATKAKNITVELKSIYKSFADQLNVSASISTLLHKSKDIKASGNEIEVALRNIFIDLLPERYKIGHGHIIDKNLTVSKQYDFIVSQGIDFQSIFKTKDSTEFFFYETIYALGEVKATWNLKNFKETRESITHLRSELSRKEVDSSVILSGNNEVRLQAPISGNPYRNPMFHFAFSVKSDKTIAKLAKQYKDKSNWATLPNVTVILNQGLYVLVNKKELEKDILLINLYPEFQADKDDYEWKFISSGDAGKNLAYLLFCLLEHLSSVVLGKPNYLEYSQSLLELDDESLMNIEDI